MIKYKKEIASRPRKDWFQSTKRRDSVRKDAKANLKDIKSNFEGQLKEKKRIKKMKSKSV